MTQSLNDSLKPWKRFQSTVRSTKCIKSDILMFFE